MHRRWAREEGERAVDGSGNRVEAPHYEAARAAYRTFLDSYPTHSAVPEVLQQLGRLQQEIFRNFDAAASTLRRVVNQYPDAQSANEARYDLGRIALLRGDLSAARLTFSRLVDRLRTGDLAEKARYELALLHFYQGEFDAALTRVEATNQNTSADVANDAIELKVLLRQNRGPDSLDAPLRLFADARLKERRHRYDESLATLDTLLSRFGRHPLADNARFMQAHALTAAGDTSGAAEQFAQIPMMHPRSPFADRSLFERARLLEAQDDLEGAVQAYNKLLEDYPKSLLAPDARARVRDLWSRQG
jgi:TolA-binding protein